MPPKGVTVVVGRLGVWGVTVFLAVGGCATDQSSPTTLPATPTTLPPTTSSTVAPLPTAAPSTSVVSTTLTPEAAEPVLALSVYEVELVGLAVELPVLASFADLIHDGWEHQEAPLSPADRDGLFDRTERGLTALLGWAEELHDRALAWDSIPGRDVGHDRLAAAAGRVEDAARAALDGLLLPSSAETVPGTARRRAMIELHRAVADLNDAVATCLGTDFALSEFEEEMVLLRLDVAALTDQAVAINQAWDDRTASYRLTEWQLVNLEQRLAGVVDRTHSLDPPATRRTALQQVESTCATLETAATGMVDGLRLPRSAEETLGTARLQALDEFRHGAEAFDRAAASALGIPSPEWRLVPALPAPRTTAPDIEPPALTVTAPESGVLVVGPAVTFTGTTEPGAFVTAAGAAATVDAGGSWTVRPTLTLGTDPVTITATDPAGNVTTLTHQVRLGYEIRPDGIGPADAGDPPDQVIAQFTTMLARPTWEEIADVEAMPLPYGYSAKSYFRITSWDEHGVTLVFSDGFYFRTDGKPGLIAWFATNPAFATPEGIHIGSTLRDLTAAYGSRLAVQTEDDGCGGQGKFFVDPAGGASEFALLWGGVTGPPFGSDSIVTLLGGGALSSC